MAAKNLALRLVGRRALSTMDGVTAGSDVTFNFTDFTAVAKAQKYIGMSVTQKASFVSMASKMAVTLSSALKQRHFSGVSGGGYSDDEEEDFDPLDVALLLSEALKEQDLECAIGGSLALSIWSTPRASMDVDMNVFARSKEQVDRMFRCLEQLNAVYQPKTHSGDTISVQAARHKSTKDHIVHCRVRNIDCDIFLNHTAVQDASNRRKKAITIRKKSVNFIDAESIACHKLIWSREKDVLDLDMLFGSYFACGASLDVDYIRTLLAAELIDDSHPAYLHLAKLSAKYLIKSE